MKICKISPYTGEMCCLEINVDESKYKNWLATPRSERPLIQNAFPELTANEREFIMTGITPNDWREIFEKKD